MAKWTLGQLGKTNPIQTQYKPNSNPIEAKTNPIQTQNKPNFRGKQMLLRKKKTKDTLAIGKDILRPLKDYIASMERKTGPLFVGSRGPLTAQGLQRIWEQSVKFAGLPKELSIHSARHTIAVHLLKKTGNLRQVQKQLGHASPATTANMYADISFEDMQNGVTGLYDQR
ncbi:MAG: tyrosine-type recombinase/integrase [Planctomycetota bacterium]